jgi:hypothetical protein
MTFGPKIIGRQPEVMLVTPSKPNLWYGSIRGDDPLTAQQRRELAKSSVDPDQVERITVTRKATRNEAYWSRFDETPLFRFECPIIRRRRDGQIEVISPSGLPALVQPDGDGARVGVA